MMKALLILSLLAYSLSVSTNLENVYCNLPWKQLLLNKWTSGAEYFSHNAVIVSILGHKDNVNIEKINPFINGSQHAERIFQSFVWVNGPFTACHVTVKRSEWTPFSTQYNIQYDNDNPLSRSDDLSVLLFDYLYTPKKCFSLSQTMLTNPLTWIPFFHSRYTIGVQFTLPSIPLPYSPLELQWVHFRGNMKLYPLGNNNQALLLQEGDSTIQYTYGGHLFALLNPQLVAKNKTEGGLLDSVIPFQAIVGLYLIPTTVILTEEHLLLHSSTTFFSLFLPIVLHAIGYNTYFNIHLFQSSSSEKLIHHNAKQCLLQYWTQQRLAQVTMNSWLLPPVQLLHNSRKEENNHFVTTATTNINTNTASLWKTFHLPQSLVYLIQTWYTAQQQQRLEQEPFISMVFNQETVPTYHIPLPFDIMQTLEEIVSAETALWLNITSSSALEITGSYGCREYRRQAIIRWHVDPVESHPITAIVHLAESPPKNDDNNGSDDNTWSLQIPKHINNGLASDLLDPQNILNISLVVGEVLLLQTAKLPHARLYPLQQAYYTNAFVHLRPKNIWTEDEVVKILSTH